MRTWSLRLLRLTLRGFHVVAAPTSAAFKSRSTLQLENLALRHQLGVLRRSVKRPKLTSADRLLWTWLCGAWSDWRSAWSSSSRKLLSAGIVRASGCSGPGEFAAVNPGALRCRRKFAN